MCVGCPLVGESICASVMGPPLAVPSDDEVVPTAGFPLRPSDEELALVERLRSRRAYLAAKRVFDVTFSLAVLAVILVPCLVVALVVWLDDPGASPIFVQRRVGRGGRPFSMLKFRTMHRDAEKHLESLLCANEKDGPVFKIRNDPRITRVGRVLRRTSLDELPQFVNVLVGHMSVVGPRPALPAEVARYNERDRLRLAVKPGITCFWQTSRNRDSISFGRWVDLDICYLRRCSMVTDLRLIVRTVGVVLTAEGA